MSHNEITDAVQTGVRLAIAENQEKLCEAAYKALLAVAEEFGYTPYAPNRTQHIKGARTDPFNVALMIIREFAIAGDYHFGIVCGLEKSTVTFSESDADADLSIKRVDVAALARKVLEFIHHNELRSL